MEYKRITRDAGGVPPYIGTLLASENEAVVSRIHRALAQLFAFEEAYQQVVGGYKRLTKKVQGVGGTEWVCCVDAETDKCGGGCVACRQMARIFTKLRAFEEIYCDEEEREEEENGDTADRNR